MDVFENIVKYLPINDINNISILDKEIYEITKYIIQKRLSNLRNHSKLIIKIKEYFLNNVNKPYSNTKNINAHELFSRWIIYNN